MSEALSAALLSCHVTPALGDAAGSPAGKDTTIKMRLTKMTAVAVQTFGTHRYKSFERKVTGVQSFFCQFGLYL